jgi:hypothetical protein
MTPLLTPSYPGPTAAGPIINGELAEMVGWSRARASRMGYFAALYTHVEVAIDDALARGEFTHPHLLARVNERFFRRYLGAFDARRAGSSASAPWEAAFEAGESDRLCVVQHLLLGMNAHINYDLPIAVTDALDPEELAAFRGDFDRMNDLLASLVDEVSDDVALCWPLLRWINRLGRGPDDVIIDFSMRCAREHAWCSALKLAPLAGAERELAIAALDAEAVRIARDVAGPSVLGRIVAAIIRAGERGTVPEIIDDLLH